MTASEDMSTPVTRGELREELWQFEARLEARFDHKLEMWGGALLARMESFEMRMETRMQSFETRMQSLETRMLTELARHTQAIQESLTTQIAVIDEKYTDLPGRVNRLEGAVFGKPRRDPE